MQIATDYARRGEVAKLAEIGVESSDYCCCWTHDSWGLEMPTLTTTKVNLES